MGGAKREYEERIERGWGRSDARVCAACIEDDSLREAVRAEETDTQGACTFCGGEASAPFDGLLEVFADGINFLYDDALNSVPYVSAEGGFVGARVWDTWDLLEDFHDCFESSVSDKIIGELRACTDMKHWVDRDDPDHGPQASLGAAWRKFCQSIKHDTRYVFWLQPDEHEEPTENGEPWEVDPATVLERVGELIDEFRLFNEYEPGYVVFRGRTFSDVNRIPSTASALGTPPRAQSLQGNRMSVAGIPMFYGGESAEVVLDEVSVRTEDRLASVGRFTASKQFRVVDLTNLPSPPSPFDQKSRDQRWKVFFLHSFIREISRPIEKGRDQIDYVPTQVMTEYLLRIRWGRRGVQGIRYPSAAHENGVCVVLDVSSGDCLQRGADKNPNKLQLEFCDFELYQANLAWRRFETVKD